MTRLLTLNEAAAELGCSVATIKRRVKAGALPVFTDGRLIRIRLDDLVRYIAERTATRTTSQRGAPVGRVLAKGARLWD